MVMHAGVCNSEPWVWGQEVQLLENLSTEKQGLALATYQAATFHYARGALETALELCERSLQVAETRFKSQHEQVTVGPHAFFVPFPLTTLRGQEQRLEYLRGVVCNGSGMFHEVCKPQQRQLLILLCRTVGRRSVTVKYMKHGETDTDTVCSICNIITTSLVKTASLVVTANLAIMASLVKMDNLPEVAVPYYADDIAGASQSHDPPSPGPTGRGKTLADGFSAAFRANPRW
jgi:hypothetical protein